MMNFAARRILIVVSLLTPAIVQAQVPWTVTLTPSVNPLAIGGCGPVSLTLLDSTGKDAPRNPSGQRVSIADFDMSVTSPDPMGVVGEYNGPSNWSACACQAATVGSSATITATYPAKMLAQTKRVRGVALQATTTFVIGKPRGAGDVPPCQALKNQTVVATGTSAANARASSAAPLVQASTAAPASTSPSTAARQGNPIVPMATLAPPVLSPLVVVVRTEWAFPYLGNISLSSGYCEVIPTTYDDPNILATDVVIVTGQKAYNGEHLTWTGTVDNGSITLNVCNTKAFMTSTGLNLPIGGRKVNILVLR